MTAPHIRIKVYDVPDVEACVRGMHREARSLAGRYATLLAFHFGLACDGAQYEAHIDLHFPQHQVIVNGAAPTAERAVREAMVKAARELERLEARDPALAAHQAQAA